MKKWNPSEYQIQEIPLIYINGDADPATSIHSAKLHYEGQKKSADKIFFTIPNGGHTESSNPDERISSCFPVFFESFESNSFANLKKNRETRMQKYQ
ncbi:MAG: hypothetical protein L6Q37_02015 [Bdellovibrionaceae bacterium]|nr:hypothetical protein [Pseudobdellovibrionaceae bacterium]NUM60166.1 hypothetical protein [Pseudobdellovibrionaceae bacterium]